MKKKNIIGDNIRKARKVADPPITQSDLVVLMQRSVSPNPEVVQYLQTEVQ